MDGAALVPAWIDGWVAPWAANSASMGRWLCRSHAAERDLRRLVPIPAACSKKRRTQDGNLVAPGSARWTYMFTWAWSTCYFECLENARQKLMVCTLGVASNALGDDCDGARGCRDRLTVLDLGRQNGRSEGAVCSSAKVCCSLGGMGPEIRPNAGSAHQAGCSSVKASSAVSSGWIRMPRTRTRRGWQFGVLEEKVHLEKAQDWTGVDLELLVPGSPGHGPHPRLHSPAASTGGTYRNPCMIRRWRLPLRSGGWGRHWVGCRRLVPIGLAVAEAQNPRGIHDPSMPSPPALVSNKRPIRADLHKRQRFKC